MSTRTLNRNQVKLLNKWAVYNHWDELPGDVRLKLAKLGSYESLWMDASRYLGDLR
jgi:hypothetical protein